MRVPCRHGLNWCGECYCLLKGKTSKHSTRRLYLPLGVKRGSMALSKPVPPTANAGASGPPVASAFRVGYPVLWEYLSSTAWEDGSARQTASLLCFVEDGLVKLCLNDRSVARTGWVSGRSWEEAVLALEMALGDDRMDWRASKGPLGRKK